MDIIKMLEEVDYEVDSKFLSKVLAIILNKEELKDKEKWTIFVSGVYNWAGKCFNYHNNCIKFDKNLFNDSPRAYASDLGLYSILTMKIDLIRIEYKDAYDNGI